MGVKYGEYPLYSNEPDAGVVRLVPEVNVNGAAVAVPLGKGVANIVAVPVGKVKVPVLEALGVIEVD
jgi:hypothetical protein